MGDAEDYLGTLYVHRVPKVFNSVEKRRRVLTT